MASRECDPERRPLAKDAPHVDPLTVRLDDMANDGESQPRTAQSTGPSSVDPVEPLEDSGQSLGGNADSIVGHFNIDLLPF